MLKPFTTERLAIRQLELQDGPGLARISDVPAVSQWMAFMEGGFPLEKAEALIASQDDTKEYFFAVRLRDGTLTGGHGGHRSPGRDHRSRLLVRGRLPGQGLCVRGAPGDTGPDLSRSAAGFSPRVGRNAPRQCCLHP